METVSLKTGKRKVILHDAFFGRYVPSGYIVFIRGETLFAIAFDAARLETRGKPAPIIEDIAGSTFGGGQFTFSHTGIFAYLRSRISGNLWGVSWLNQDGKITPIMQEGAYFDPRLSPDGKRLASFTGRGSRDIWVTDLERGTQTKVTFTGENMNPVWHPSGKYLAYSSANQRRTGIQWIREDGSGEPATLMEGTRAAPCCFSPDGKILILSTSDASGWKILALPLDTSDPDHPKPGKLEAIYEGITRLSFPALSPDGRWMAYTSSESGSQEVYVRPFNGKSFEAGKWQISVGGGSAPAWSRAGRQLLYLGLNRRIMVVDYETQADAIRAGKPRVWLDKDLGSLANIPISYDVAPDGKRIIVLTQTDEQKQEGNLHAMFLINFFDELKRRVSSVPPGP